MADGTTDAPAPPLRERREMVPIQFTNKYDSYAIPGGPQLNAGEQASVPKDEAERLIRDGAAVRQTESAAPSEQGKASSHPPSHKMQTGVAAK